MNFDTVWKWTTLARRLLLHHVHNDERRDCLHGVMEFMSMIRITTDCRAAFPLNFGLCGKDHYNKNLINCDKYRGGSHEQNWPPTWITAEFWSHACVSHSTVPDSHYASPPHSCGSTIHNCCHQRCVVITSGSKASLSWEGLRNGTSLGYDKPTVACKESEPDCDSLKLICPARLIASSASTDALVRKLIWKLKNAMITA